MCCHLCFKSATSKDGVRARGHSSLFQLGFRLEIWRQKRCPQSKKEQDFLGGISTVTLLSTCENMFTVFTLFYYVLLYRHKLYACFNRYICDLRSPVCCQLAPEVVNFSADLSTITAIETVPPQHQTFSRKSLIYTVYTHSFAAHIGTDILHFSTLLLKYDNLIQFARHASTLFPFIFKDGTCRVDDGFVRGQE